MIFKDIQDTLAHYNLKLGEGFSPGLEPIDFTGLPVSYVIKINQNSEVDCTYILDRDGTELKGSEVHALFKMSF